MGDAALLGQLATTLPLVGLILVVQIVHYPLFTAVGEHGFAAYHRRHSHRIGLLVVPLMLGEAAAATAWLVSPPAWLGPGIALSGAALLAVVWLSTALLQVPRHARLSHGYDDRTVRTLVASNWLRTAAWTARGVLLLSVVAARI